MSRSHKIKKTNDVTTDVSLFLKNFDSNTDEHNDKDHCNKEIAIPRKIHTFYGDLKSGMNIHLIQNYLDPELADSLFEGLKRIQYNSDEESMVRVMGVRHKIPRKQTAFGEPGTNYHFAGITVAARDWTNQDNTLDATVDSTVVSTVGRELKCIASRTGRMLGTKFNYALINNYLDNTNCIGYHSDDEKELGRYPIIAGISLGQERLMYFKSKVTGDVIKISLPHNSLVIMHYPTNKFWAHSIPKTARKMGQRISLTFRSVSDL